MSDKEPREFWIVNEARVYTSFGFVIDAHGIKARSPGETRHHVIEKSAYDQQQVLIAELTEWVYTAHHKDGCENRYDKPCSCKKYELLNKAKEAMK